MMLANPTPYSSVPPMPMINALPGGVPRGPWGPLYRSAPGAQIPAVRYPGMMGAGALGTAPVQIVGALGDSTAAKAASVALQAGVAAAVGALFAWSVRSRRPMRTTAAVSGGLSLLTGLYALSRTA